MWQMGHDSIDTLQQRLSLFCRETEEVSRNLPDGSAMRLVGYNEAVSAVETYFTA